MKITLIPSDTTGAGVAINQYSTCFLINDHVAIDAGALGFYRGPAEQAKIRHLFLSHTHMDHLASLPIFLENIIGSGQPPVNVHASAEVQYCLRNDIFNDRVWANFIELTDNGRPFLKLQSIAHGQTVAVEGLRITPVTVNHAVPTLGFVIEDDKAAVIIAGDTGPTEEIWRRANQTPNLRAIYLEAAFTDANAALADLTKHLTPASFAREVKKVKVPVKFFAVHIKARFREAVIKELQALKLPNVEIAKFGTAYEF